MKVKKYVVGYSENSLGEGDFVFLRAKNKNEAIKEFVSQYATKDRFFLEYIYSHITNASFAEQYWFQTDDENAALEERGEIIIDNDTFNKRVRDAFGQHQDYAEMYLKYYWGNEENKDYKNIFPDEMLMFMWELSEFSFVTAIEQLDKEDEDLEWDVFISHASEDKETFVKSLALELGNYGVKVWYDEFTLKVGDSLRRSIEKGLSNSKFGVVVLSPNFFEKEWPQRELDALFVRELDNKKIILPIWLDLEFSDVVKVSPLLADRKASKANSGLETVVRELMDVIKPNL